MVVATKHAVEVRFRVWEDDIPIVDGTNIGILNREIVGNWEMDCVISLFDIWTLKKEIDKHIAAWIPIDTQNVNEKIVKAAKNIPIKIAMSKHGESELQKAGFETMYAPIGYDPDVFYPKPDAGYEFRKSLIFPNNEISPDEMFLIGSVGINYPGDRKGFILLMLAFREFHKRHDNARLFLHTIAHKEHDGLNYAAIASDLGIGELVAWPHQDRMWYGLYDEEVMSEIYSGFDVFCLPTKGEGFGRPIIEAQACGTPVIVSNNTSGPELCRMGWLIDTHWDDAEYLGSNVWRYPPRPSAILDALEKAYEFACVSLEGPVASRRTRQAISKSVAEFTWDNVWSEYWTPIMAKVEEIAQCTESD